MIAAIGLFLFLQGGAASPAPRTEDARPSADEARSLVFRPLVFRSVLDGRPRVATLTLDDDLWVAWDATECRVVRAWKGGVDLVGAVYTAEHGPQPRSGGFVYLDGHARRFELEEGTLREVGTPRWLGHRLPGDGSVVLRYELSFPGGARTVVEETLRTRHEEDELVLEQSFAAAPGTEGTLRLSLARAVDVEALVDVRWNGSPPTTELVGEERRLALTFSKGSGTLETRLRPATDDEVARARTAAEAARSEARSGDAPEAEPESPALERLDETESASRQDAVHGALRPGVSVRVFDVGLDMDRLMELVPGQTPNLSFVLPLVELRGARGDFGEIEERFLTCVEGFLEVPSPGLWGLRLTSDDGGRLFLDGVLALDHDGLHGPDPPLEGERELPAGLVPFELTHFENSGGADLVLEWRAPGESEFTTIPGENLWCRAGEVRVTSPGAKKVVAPLVAGNPGDGLPLVDVHPSFELATVRPAGFEPPVGGLDWLSDGTLVLCTWDPEGAVYLLRGTAGDDRDAISVERFAEGLAEPLGLAVVDDRIFVLQKQELTELVDTDGDGTADEYRCVSAEWDVSPNFHEFAFGLAHHEGRLWANLAIAIDPGGRSSIAQEPDRGSVIAIDPDDGVVEIVARGLRTPNGIGRGHGGELFLTDNQGDWVPVSKLDRVVEGAFYGNRSVLREAAAGLEASAPVVWLPQGEIGNSPGEPLLVPDGVGPYSGQMLHCEVTHGGLKRVFLEEVEGVLQGAVFRFTQGLEGGVNRARFGPDGALYVGGIGSTGNWGQTGKERFGLQRLRYTGAPAFEILAVRARSNGLELEFTEPLAERLGWDPAVYEVRRWHYVPTEDYGGPKLGERALAVRSASPDAEGRRVFLELPELASSHAEGLARGGLGSVVHVRLALPLSSAGGRRPWSTEAWCTLHRLPAGVPGAVHEAPESVAHNALDDDERAAGWELLFDGESLAGWHNFGSDGPVEGWEVEDGCLVRTGPGGDLVTDGEFEDFELRLEWRISRGGNSGIFFHVRDDLGAVWESGPEMQVLDDREHADGVSPLTSAGANYALVAPARDVVRPLGLFNEARIRVEGGRVTHWLNGERIVDYELGSPEWEALVAGSKFASMPHYGRSERARIALQDHGDRVWFRDVAVRRLGEGGGSAPR